MINNPLVSIIIPVYNGELYIREAIYSALNQTYNNIEVIVVNDGSIDKTREICLSFGDSINYYEKENGGVSTALNLGIKKMKGTYFSWLSHDDFYYLDKVEMQIKALIKDGNMEKIVFSNYDLLNEYSKNITRQLISKNYKKELLQNGNFCIMENVLNCCTLLVPRGKFVEFGLFDKSLRSTQDYDLFFKILKNQELIYIKESLLCSRVHKDQGSITIKSHNFEREKLFLNFYNLITDEEIESIYENKYKFIYKLMLFFYSNSMKQGFDSMKQEIEKLENKINKSEEILKFKKKIRKLTSNKDIYIFGSGAWGKKLFLELESRYANIKNFIDNDLKKIDTYILGKKCIRLEDLKERDNFVILIATRNSIDIEIQLIDNDIKQFILKQELDQVFMETDYFKIIL